MALSNLFIPNDYRLFCQSLEFSESQKSPLNVYYESGPLTDLTYSLAGTTITDVPYGSSLTRPTFTRIGNTVTCTLPDIEFTPNANVTADVVISGLENHALFVPSINVPFPFSVDIITLFDAADPPVATAAEVIHVFILTDGTINLSLPAGSTGWGTHKVVVSPLSFSYIVDYVAP